MPLTASRAGRWFSKLKTIEGNCAQERCAITTECALTAECVLEAGDGPETACASEEETARSPAGSRQERGLLGLDSDFGMRGVRASARIGFDRSRPHERFGPARAGPEVHGLLGNSALLWASSAGPRFLPFTGRRTILASPCNRLGRYCA